MSYIKLIRRSALQKPVATTVTAESPIKNEPTPARFYPDGEAIPATLPGLYAPANLFPATGEPVKRCDNCAAWIESTRFCKTWNAVVRPEYVCAVWQTVA